MVTTGMKKMPKRFSTQYVERPDLINQIYAQLMGKAWLPFNEEEVKKIEIKELPIMTLNDGTIVCIPKLPEMGLIACVGLTGTGKTLSAGYIISNIFYSWQDYVAVLNDSQEETFTWSEPNNVEAFNQKLKKLGQKPMPLPMIYLFPNSDNFKVKEETIENKNSLVVSVPFEEVMENIEKYLPDLGASQKYLIEKKAELLEANTEGELFEIISSIDSGISGMKEARHKIDVSFKTLISEGILNISKDGSPAYLQVIDTKTKKEIYNGNPFTAIMKAECIPSFITSDLYTQKYKDAIFSYYIDSLFVESMSGKMKGKRVWIYFDELAKVVNTKPQDNSPETEKSLNNIASRGRNNGISLIYATQNYNEIPRIIRSQTKTALIFRHKHAEQAKLICEDFGIDKTSRVEITKLKKHEAIATTTDYFICYKDNKRWESQGPFKGMTFPPLHRNKFVGEKKK